MSDLDGRLARALDEAVPQPPRDLDPESLRSTGSGRRRRSLTPALAAAAIVVVAVGVGFVRHHDAPGSAPAGSPRGITAQAVARLLAAAPTVPGATQVDHPPVEVLDRPMQEPGTANVVRRTHWWTAPGTMAGALRYVDAHRPPGVALSGRAGGSARTDGNPVRRGLFFAAVGRQWKRPSAYTELELLVAVAPFRGGVVIRMDAEAIWLPQRTPGEHIPGNVTSVSVVRSKDGNTLGVGLRATEARKLAAVINGLPVLPPTKFQSCPAYVGAHDKLTFHGPDGAVRVEATTSGCGYVKVGDPGPHDPALGDAGTLDHAVAQALAPIPIHGR